ncbi:hypothetical protein [uncultured Mesonia sp.]|uniref:hypothetical protein n=1 Tax=uncultured Mesonia sp. TaxID=399731 RepID=UPI00374E34A2
MKKRLLTLMAILTSTLTFACSCNEIKPIIEFYSSEYVFEGKVISKVYAKDSLTYKITFDISKHYKNGDLPKKIEFEAFSKGKYIGIGSNCEYYPEKGEIWLVYASRYKGKFHFPNVCSNSKNLDYKRIRASEQKILDNGNSFKIENYIFEYENAFNYCENITDISSILEKGKIKEYKTQTTLLNVSIDSNGNLKSVTRQRELIRKKDSIFNLTIEIGDANRKPITEFEKDAIELISQVKKWEIKKHKQTGINVPYIRHIWVYYDLKTNKWSYNL